MSRNSKNDQPDESKSSPIEPPVPVGPNQVRVIEQNCIHETVLGAFFQSKI